MAKYAFLFTFLFSAVIFANDRFDSAGTVLVDVTISDGWFETNNGNKAAWPAEIRSQLQYIIGNFDHKNTPGLWHTLTVNLGTAVSGDLATYGVPYRATFQLAWTRRERIPASVSVLVPIRGDAQGMRDFEDKYAASCGKAPLWYYFRPQNETCILSKTDSQSLTLDFKVSPSNTDGKSPDYSRIWEDGKLVLTHIRGNLVSKDPLDWHRTLSAEGPSKTTVRAEATYTVTITDSLTAAGPVILRTMEITDGNMQSVGQKFMDEFRAFAKDSDVLGYNGHAGLGKNVRAFTKLAQFSPNRYYLTWINACVPFAYLDKALFTSSQSANPGSPWSKNLDVLIVTNIGSFAAGYDVKTLIDVLSGKKATYRSFLDSLTSGYPAVIGEHDNL